MRYNKSLGIAIATILSGGIGLAAHAGQFTFAIGDDTVQTESQSVASEGVDKNGGSPSPLPNTANGGAGDVTTWFEFQRSANIIFNIYIDYTLTGATFNADLVAPEFTSNFNTTTAAITLIKGGKADDNTVRYLLQASKSNIKTNNEVGDATAALREEDRLVLSFSVKDVEGLANNSGAIKLKAEWGAADVTFVPSDSASVTLFESKPGVTVIIADIDSPAKVDVTKGNKKFVGGVGGSETAIILGTVAIASDSTYSLVDGAVDGGTFVVVGGPFSASTGENQVFLDINGSDCVFTEESDVAATVDGDEATFELEDTHIIAMDDSTTNVCVVVADDNETDINDTKDKASGSLTIDYPDKSETYVGRLSRTKRNGTSCSLYNVPHKQASDRGWYRFFNKTNVDSTVWGSVRDRDGTRHLIDQELGIAKANGTLVVNSDQLHDYAIAQTGAAAENPWAGRAVLTINSNSTKMEAYGMLRAKNTSNVLVPAGVTTPSANIGPLINLSAGATGNGCE